EQIQIEDRARDAALGGDKGRRGRDARNDPADREGGGHTPARRLLQCDQERRYRGGEEHRSGEIERAASVVLTVSWQRAPADREARETQDERESEDAAPADGVGDEA